MIRNNCKLKKKCLLKTHSTCHQFIQGFSCLHMIISRVKFLMIVSNYIRIPNKRKSLILLMRQ